MPSNYLGSTEGTSVPFFSYQDVSIYWPITGNSRHKYSPRCIKTHTQGSPTPPLHKQIVPDDWLVRFMSLYFHRHTNGNNTKLSFISSLNCKCSFFFFFFFKQFAHSRHRKGSKRFVQLHSLSKVRVVRKLNKKELKDSWVSEHFDTVPPRYT